MTPAARRWPVVLVIAGEMLCGAGAGRATPQGPVYIVPITHQDTQQPDAMLSRAFRSAVSLRVPVSADWRLSEPDPVICQRGCRVIRITGRRAPTPNYQLALRQFPQGREVAATRFAGPADTTVDLLADALLLKTSFLLRIDLVRRRREAVTPRPRVSRSNVSPSPPRRPPRLQLSLGPSSMLGMDADLISAGLEAAVSLRLLGPFTVRAVAGWQVNGQISDGLSRFHAFPLHLLLGAQWHWTRFELGLFAGGTAMLFWVRFDDSALALARSAEMKGISGGPTGELRLGVRAHRRLSIGLTNRVTYMVSSLRTEVGGLYDTTARFQVPHVLYQVALEVSLNF